MARVLIIDDDFEIVAILTEILKHEGHEISSAGEPVSGMQMARKVKPELIILDYHMPGNTGSPADEISCPACLRISVRMATISKSSSMISTRAMRPMIALF